MCVQLMTHQGEILLEKLFWTSCTLLQQYTRFKRLPCGVANITSHLKINENQFLFLEF